MSVEGGNQVGSPAIFDFKDPHVEKYELGNTRWMLSGVRLCPNKDWHFYLGEQGAEEKLCRQWGDVLIVRADFREDGSLALVQAWKGLSASYELYFGTLDGGQLLVADNFRTVCAHLPPERRSIREDAIIDHLLFRAVTNDQTHIEGIRRLGFGSTVVLRADGHVLKEDIFHKVQASDPEQPTNAYLDRIHAALEESVTPVRHFSKLATLFTGGIDSTLVQTYTNGWATPVNVRPDYPIDKSHLQSGDALRAAHMTGTELLEVPLLAETTLQEMIRSIRLAGLPQTDFHTLLWPSVLATDYDVFLSGEQAHAYFCGAGTREAIVAYWLNRLVPFLVSGDQPPRWACVGRLKVLWAAAKRMARSTDDVYSTVSLVSCGDYTNIPWLSDVFGVERVEARLANRMNYVGDRIDPDALPNSDLYSRVMLSAWTGTMSNEELSRVRQIAHSLGKVVHSPFSSGRLVQTSMSIPVQKRYETNFESMYLLKKLLKRRLPQYPVDQAKGDAGPDFESLYQSGPLSSIWDRYPVPAYVPNGCSDDIKAAALRPKGGDPVPAFTWNIANLAIWEQEVLKKAELPRRKVSDMVASNDNDPVISFEVDDSDYHNGRREKSRTTGH